MSTRRRPCRPSGLVLALLALGLLSALAPFHQTSRLLGDLRLAGFQRDLGWAICGSAHSGTEDPANTAQGGPGFQCPAQGIGKDGFAAVLPATFALAQIARAARRLRTVARPWRRCKRCRPGTARPRAPPSAV